MTKAKSLRLLKLQFLQVCDCGSCCVCVSPFSSFFVLLFWLSMLLLMLLKKILQNFHVFWSSVFCFFFFLVDIKKKKWKNKTIKFTCWQGSVRQTCLFFWKKLPTVFAIVLPALAFCTCPCCSCMLYSNHLTLICVCYAIPTSWWCPLYLAYVWTLRSCHSLTHCIFLSSPPPPPLSLSFSSLLYIESFGFESMVTLLRLEEMG